MKQYVCLADHSWSTVLTRTQQLLARLRDAQVLYFEPASQRSIAHLDSARRVRPNVLAYTLPYIPDTDAFYGLRLRRGLRMQSDYISSKLERHRFHDPVLWVTHPQQAAMLDYLSFQGLVYDCDTYYASSLGLQEDALAKAADVIFAASPGLVDRLSPCNPNIALIPNGVNYPMFCRSEPDIPAELAAISGPILGLTQDILSMLDLAPVEYAAEEHPDWTFVLVGAVEGNSRLNFLLELPNVIFVDASPLIELPDYLRRFDVCLHLLPCGAVDTDVIPSRIYEYLSTGKPIVSMLYEDQVEPFPDVIYGAHTPEEFSLLCGHALAESHGWVAERRRNYGKSAAWTLRTAEVTRILEGIGLY